MKPSTSLMVLHSICHLDLQVLYLSREWDGPALSVSCIAMSASAGEMQVWNSMKKLTRCRLLSPTKNPSKLGPITDTGRTVLEEGLDANVIGDNDHIATP